MAVATVCYCGSCACDAFIYIFREAYIVLIIEQYWSLVNSTLSSNQARRINGPFCGIASLGAIGRWASREAIGRDDGFRVAASLCRRALFPAAVCSGFAYALAGEPKPSEEEAGGKKGHIGVELFLKSRYLVLIGLLILTTQTVSTVLDLRFNVLVEIERVNPDERTAFYGSFYAVLNTAALLLQFIAVPLILRFVHCRQRMSGFRSAPADVRDFNRQTFVVERGIRLSPIQSVRLFHLSLGKRDFLHPSVIR